jgi:hypothetical protein
MPNLRLEVIVPKEGLADVPRLMRVVENTLNEQAEAVRQQFLNTVETWNTKPEFVTEKSPGERRIYTRNLIYMFVNNGTKRHIIPHPTDIYPGRKPLRFYRTGFRAKSRVGLISRSNKGAVAGKDLTFAKWVDHPGTEARKFDEAIQKKWQKELPKQLQRAIDTEFRR